MSAIFPFRLQPCSSRRLARATALLVAAAAICATAPGRPAAAAPRPSPEAAPAGPQRPERPERPQRIVSLNLCADQYLIELADPSQIAGLTPNARDPRMSAGAARARSLPVMRDTGEQLVALVPDLVLGFAGGAGTSRALPQGGRYRFLAISSADSYADIVTQIRRVAAAIGQRPRGEALIAAMDRELAAIRPVAHAGTAAYYQRRGFLTGGGTLVDELMRRVGLTNLATRLGRPPLSRLSVEELVAERPDWLVVESATERVTDQGTEMLHHPALDGIPRLRLPQAWVVCGSPAYVRAARSLADQLRGARR